MTAIAGYELRPGRILQHRIGARFRLVEPIGRDWFAERLDTHVPVLVPHEEIELTGSQRLWWLDE